MPRYWAEVSDGQVQRVVVCDDPGWLVERLGGEWVESFRDHDTVTECAPGYGHDDEWPQRFAPPWRQPLGAGVEDAPPYGVGSVVYHNGELWTSTVPDNVWEPGVSGWRPVPANPGEPPRWVQPTGAHDAYAVGEHVVHAGQVWRNTTAANVWEPGTVPGLWVPA